MIDKKEAIRLRKMGVTLQEIADKYEVTRQAVYCVVRDIQPPKNGWPARRKPSGQPTTFDRVAWSRDWNKHHLKVDGKYIYARKRSRPDGCEICGKQARKLDYHYWDKEHPEYGIWVCVRCHSRCAFVENGGYNRYTELKRQIEQDQLYPSSANQGHCESYDHANRYHHPDIGQDCQISPQELQR